MELDFDILFKSLNINERWDSTAIKKCIKNIILNENFVKYKVDKKEYKPDGGNYLGTLCEINIKGETAIEDKEINLFLKIITPGEKMTMLSMPEVYKNELFFYCELSKIFAEVQDEADLPQNRRFKIVKCYRESSSSVIILENMVMKGYKTNFRMDCITLKYAELAVEQLAKFHALSFVLEDRRPKYFDKKIKSIHQAFKFNEEFDCFIRNMCKIAINCLDKDNRKKFDNFIPTFAKKYDECLTTKCSRNVLCHGDYRANNIIMKEVNGEIIEVIPIDYQLMYYGCPVFDFMYLIFLSTDRNFRKANLSYLKDFYYNSLKTFLEYFRLDAAIVYPKHEFDKHYEERLGYGLMCSIIILPFIFANEDDIPDVTSNTLAELDISVDNQYKDRIVGIIEDYIEWGYL